MIAEFPPVAILLLTYRRTAEALRTIESTCQHLNYPSENLGWYVADDGSDTDHHDALLRCIAENGMFLIGHHNDRFREDGSFNCGKGWNKGLGLCHQFSDFVLQLEDDWIMENDLNLRHYVRLLEGKPEVGIVTFRILSVGADLQTVGWDGEVFTKYLRSTQYAYSGNPLLRHGRYTKYYGWFAEDRNPGLIELHQDDMYRLDVKNGPEIWRPATLDQWGGWHHIGEKVWH